jgi:hypothetical protein
VPADPKEPNPEQLDSSNKKSLDKLHSLVDDLKVVEEHEKAIVDDDPPLFRRMMEPTPACEQCVSLKDRYRLILREYIQAANSLDQLSDGPELERAYRSAEQIRLNFDALRKDYQRHLQTNGESSPR